MTGYDPTGLATEWGKADFGRIYRLAKAWDRLQSKWSQPEVKHRKRYTMKRAANRIRLKIQNIVRELHCKLVKWLIDNYHLVLLPSFETSGIVKRATRKINGKTAHAMLTWSHYKFKRRLLDKTREHPWCKVLIVDEDYTSQTCGLCGWLHKNLGSRKVNFV